jgi:O-antigen/teichoic acid export membrane protein
MIDETNLSGTQLSRNSLMSAFRFFISAPIPLLVVPFMLNKLGTDLFGLWALIGVMSAVGQLGDFGIGLMIVKSVAEMNASKGSNRLNDTVSTAFVLYVSIALILGLLIYYSSGYLVRNILSVPQVFFREAQYLLRVYIVIISAGMITNIYISIINGLQRIDISSGILLVTNIVNAIGVVIVLSLGMGLNGLVVNNLFTAIGTGISAWFIVKKIAPHINIKLSNFHWREVKSILGYGSNIQVINIAGLLGDPLVRAMISMFAGVSFVAYYEITMRIMTPFRSMFSQAINPLMPFAAESHALGERISIINVYKKATSYVMLISIPLFMLLFLLLPSFIELWIGPNYEISTYTFRILSIGSLISVISMPCGYIFLSTHVKYMSLFAIANGILDIIFCIGLGYYWGYFGIVIGFSLVMGILSLVAIRLFCKTFQLSYRTFTTELPWKGCIIALILSLIVYFVLLWWPKPGVLFLLFITILFIVLYLLFLWMLGVLTDTEIKSFFISVKSCVF